MIETEELVVRYGRSWALKGVDLSVQRGDIYGFVGPNGAGKTSTLRVLTTLLSPTSGRVTVAGHSVTDEPQEVRRLVGYMPDRLGLYEDMSVGNYLRFFASAYGLPVRGQATLIDRLLTLVDLVDRKTQRIGALSRGMRQRLGLARALVHDPPVLILDEPASGLDPRARTDLLDILRELQDMGKTILLSSHILSEIEEVCSRVGVLVDGKLVAQGTLGEVVAEHHPGRTVLVKTDDNERASLVLGELATVEDSFVEEDQVVVYARADLRLSDLSSHLFAKGLALSMLMEEAPSLNQVFLHLCEEPEAGLEQAPVPNEAATRT